MLSGENPNCVSWPTIRHSMQKIRTRLKNSKVPYCFLCLPVWNNRKSHLSTLQYIFLFVIFVCHYLFISLSSRWTNAKFAKKNGETKHFSALHLDTFIVDKKFWLSIMRWQIVFHRRKLQSSFQDASLLQEKTERTKKSKILEPNEKKAVQSTFQNRLLLRKSLKKDDEQSEDEKEEDGDDDNDYPMSTNYA